MWGAVALTYTAPDYVTLVCLEVFLISGTVKSTGSHRAIADRRVFSMVRISFPILHTFEPMRWWFSISSLIFWLIFYYKNAIVLCRCVLKVELYSALFFIELSSVRSPEYCQILLVLVLGLLSAESLGQGTGPFSLGRISDLSSLTARALS